MSVLKGRPWRWHVKGLTSNTTLTKYLERGWEPFAVTGRTVWVRKYDWRKQP